MANYNDLAEFVVAHKSDPVSLAKVITAWEWASLLPGGYGSRPTSAESVPAVLNASCGWRDVLMKALFAEIGIEGRQVNFYDVPFQGNHTATELLIDGKWMFFDPTFGIYFQSEKGGGPLSIAEARAQWPDVIVKQAHLPGWQGKFIDLDAISSSRAYSNKTGTFSYHPASLFPTGDVIGGELNSLYFGAKAAYYVGGKNTFIDSGETTVLLRKDKGDRALWSERMDTFDADSRLDFRYIKNDDRSTSFKDWDLDDKFDWQNQVTFVTSSSRFDYSVTIQDDRRRIVWDNDQANAHSWRSKVTVYTSSGAADYQIAWLHDGGSSTIDWDAVNEAPWKQSTDVTGTGGAALTTTFVLDDGTTKMIAWSAANTVVGTSGADSLLGGPGPDLLVGGGGRDVLSGGGEIDRLEGGLGDDAYVSADYDLVVEEEGGGTDTVYSAVSYSLGLHLENLVLTENAVYGTGNHFDNVIVGTAGANVLSGGSGRDKVFGEAGRDILTGGADADVIEGGAGADVLYGNAGADVFRWRAIDETDVTIASADAIRDFSYLSGDRINFALLDANSLQNGRQSFSFIGEAALDRPGQIRYSHSGGHTLVLLNTDRDSAAEAMIRLAGLHDPQADWFMI